MRFVIHQCSFCEDERKDAEIASLRAALAVATGQVEALLSRVEDATGRLAVDGAMTHEEACAALDAMVEGRRERPANDPATLRRVAGELEQRTCGGMCAHSEHRILREIVTRLRREAEGGT